MCSCNGIGHWITHSPITPPDSSAASRFDSPTSACHRNPEQLFQWCRPRIVVEHGGSLVEPASVPRVRESELLEIEMVAEFVTKSAQERPKRGNSLPHCRPHPHPDQH